MTEATVTQAIDLLERAHGKGGLGYEAHGAIEYALGVLRATAASQASDAGQVEDIARKAMRKAEVARTDVVRPVNGTAPYTVVIFHGQRIEFHDNEWTIEQHRDAGSSKAAAYAQSINDGLFALAKDAIVATLTAPPTSDAGEASQRLQDHMEQHHGVCLSASEWDAAAAATRPTSGEALTQLQAMGQEFDAGGDVLEDHFPSGLRSEYPRTACRMPVPSGGIKVDCRCGWSTNASDEQEARQQWADHVRAALTKGAE